MLAELLSLAEIRDIIVSERMKVYEASFNFDLNNAPDYSYFFNIINFIPKRDNIKITLQDENERIFEVSSSKTEGEEEYKTFLKNTLDDETINVKLRIDKKVEENHFSIYSYDEFVKDILMLSIEQVMIAFSGLLSQVSTFSSGTGCPASRQSIFPRGPFTWSYLVMTMPFSIRSPRQSRAAFAMFQAALPAATRITRPGKEAPFSARATASSGCTARMEEAMI